MDKQRNKKFAFGESKTEEPSFAKASADKPAGDPSSAKASAGEEKKDSEDLKKRMEECEKKRDDYLKGWQRSQADFINYKKEEIARMKEILKYGGAELILTFLPILDNFEKAEKETPKELQDNQYFKGILQIKKQIQDFLKNQGIKEIESVGKKVDLNLHEIVGEVEMKDKESGTIIEETQKGYLFEDKLLRVAKVRISK
jgi:molecular chaperone GrpE